MQQVPFINENRLIFVVFDKTGSAWFYQMTGFDKKWKFLKN
jgi:hypothetical protein